MSGSMSLSDRRAALYKCTSEGNTPSRTPAISESATVGLLPDLDLASTPS